MQPQSLPDETINTLNSQRNVSKQNIENPYNGAKEENEPERNFSLYEMLGDSLGKFRLFDKGNVKQSVLTDFSKDMDVASELESSETERITRRSP